MRIFVLTAMLPLVAPALAAGAEMETVRSGSVVVLAAASLMTAFQAAAREFEHTHTGLHVQFSFAGSSTLVQQIEQGAPADVFTSADEETMHTLVTAGRVAGSAQIVARNRLQIVVAAGNPKGIASLADLARPGLVLALGGPTVPVGRYARAAFAKAGVAVPAASEELDVKAIVAKIALGEADAGIAYVTDVRAGGSAVSGIEIPESLNVTAQYSIAVLQDAPHPAAARAFVAFILSPAGQGVLAGCGFLPP